MSNLDDILAKAKEQSANIAPLAPVTSAPAPAPVGGFNMSMDAMLNAGGMEVAAYIQVKEGGIKLDKSWTGFVDDFEAIIDMSEVQLFMGIRKEVGSVVTYAKSYDGINTVKGENFLQVCADFKRDSQKPADPYRGADIPMTLVSDQADPKKTGKALEAGTVVGLSTSITGFKPWATFHKKLNAAGLGQAQVKVRVKHAARKNAANQAYGVCEFDFLEVVDGTAVAA